MNDKTLSITTIKNGKELEWITIIEDGIPMWVPRKNADKHLLIQQLDDLFKEAREAEDDEPVVAIICEEATYEVTYFQAAGLYLCDDLEDRYVTLATLTDALWGLVCDKNLVGCKLL